ncbi:MAG TPA: type IX secretion system membrane protein PorP/SprF [Bacteroidia bacterium]|jgi:type IX secretion system PorP/SprF family membrane protein|nr:type IX secretion system membrane protein PorP/SprF [Bacteroidia bacterium]
MKNKIITTISGILLSLGALAQQDASFSQYFFNPLYINPAYAGSRGIFSGTMVYRAQWIDMDGTPTTESVGMHSMIPNSNVGLGLQFYNDNAGPLTTTNISAIFAYHLPLGDDMKLSFGLEGCMDNVNISYNKIALENTSDLSYTNNNSSSWLPDANAGLYLYRDRFFMGFSVKHLLQPNFNLQAEGGLNNAQYFREYYFTSGFVTNFSENLGIRPSILVKYVQGAPIDLDIDASLVFYDKLFIGAGIRTDKRIDIDGMDNILVLSIEYDIINRLRFGYSYDVYLSPNESYFNGTHEIMLGWDLNSNKTRMTSPKYF